MRKIIMPAIFLVVLILSTSQLVAATAQEDDFTLTLNPGAISSDSRNPISPANITVPTGTNVTWINKDSSPHFIVSGNPEEGPDNIFYGDFFATDENYTVTFDNPGIYPYYDPAWKHIRGQITVEDVSFPSELAPSANDSSIEGIAGNAVPDSIVPEVNNSSGSEVQTSEGSDTFSVPSSSSALSSQSPFIDGGTEESSFSQSNETFSIGDVNDQSSFPSSSSSLSSSGSDQTLMGLFEQVGPLLGLLANGSSATSPLSSLFQSNETFSSDDISDQSPSISSSGSDQSLSGLFEQIGPLLGLFMNGTSSTSSSPLSSLFQSNEMSNGGLLDFANVNTTGFEGAQSLDRNSSSLLNEPYIFQNGSLSTSDDERTKVQEELINVLKKAYSVGAEIPELPSFHEDDNATIFVKLNVINPIDKRTNATYLSASDFSLTGTYQTKDGTSGGLFGPVNDAGRIFVIPASAYSIIEDTAQTGMEPRDSLLNSYSTSYSKGCSGHIDYMESKDCTITKKYMNMTNNINIDSGN